MFFPSGCPSPECRDGASCPAPAPVEGRGVLSASLFCSGAFVHVRAPHHQGEVVQGAATGA
eukprot:1722928-Prorocentrum_lima.AAC.1